MREAADTMFVLLFAVSIVLYMVAFIGARPIATFFYANVGSIWPSAMQLVLDDPACSRSA